MITEDQIPEMVFEAEPGFRQWIGASLVFQRWTEELVEFQMAFAEYLVERIQENQTERFPVIFEVIERLIIEGDVDTHNRIVIGLFEDLQHESEYSETFDCEALVPWPEPESRKAWIWAGEWTGLYQVSDEHE